MENRLLVFAYNEKELYSPSIIYRGHFNGEKFIPRPGYCESLEELYTYDYVQLFSSEGCKSHLPKRKSRDLLKEMKWAYSEIFGEQVSLF